MWVSVTPMESARICSRLLGIPLREFARLPRGAAAARIAPAPAPARSVVLDRARWTIDRQNGDGEVGLRTTRGRRLPAAVK